MKTITQTDDSIYNTDTDDIIKQTDNTDNSIDNIDNSIDIDNIDDINDIDDIDYMNDIDDEVDDEVNDKVDDEVDNINEIKFTKSHINMRTIDVHLTNVEFKEEDLIHELELTDRIIEIGCNFGVITSEEMKQIKLLQKTKKSNRGRKPKVEVEKKRKRQGTGDYINCQITFVVKSDRYPDKLYKIKVFRNGRIQIPGASKYASENFNCINCIKEQLQVKLNKKIKYTVYDTGKPYKFIIRNIKFGIINNNVLIDRSELIRNIHKYYQNYPDLTFDIPNVRYLLEKYPGAIVKLRPNIDSGILDTKDNNNKNREELRFSTLKIFESGKINIDACTTNKRHHIIKSWLKTFLNSVHNDVMIEIDESSDEEYILDIVTKKQITQCITTLKDLNKQIKNVNKNQNIYLKNMNKSVKKIMKFCKLKVK